MYHYNLPVQGSLTERFVLEEGNEYSLVISSAGLMNRYADLFETDPENQRFMQPFADLIWDGDTATALQFHSDAPLKAGCENAFSKQFDAIMKNWDYDLASAGTPVLLDEKEVDYEWCQYEVPAIGGSKRYKVPDLDKCEAKITDEKGNSLTLHGAMPLLNMRPELFDTDKDYVVDPYVDPVFENGELKALQFRTRVPIAEGCMDDFCNAVNWDLDYLWTTCSITDYPKRIDDQAVEEDFAKAIENLDDDGMKL